MSLSAILTALMLPPMLFVLIGLAGILLAWRGWRPGLALAALAAVGQLLLATPLAARLLIVSLEQEEPPEPGGVPAAIIVLGAEAALTRDGAEIGALTLERLRTGAALHRRTGLPVLVSGGTIRRVPQPLAALMAASLQADFGITARWLESQSRDTWENAAFSAAILREAGIGSAYIVTHGWHMPRALAAFGRRGVVTQAAPVRLDRMPDGAPGDWVPRADWWGVSWFALRERAGRLVYALRG